MSKILYTWTSVEKRCGLCNGGKNPPRWGCWRCNGAGVYRVARLIPLALDAAGGVAHEAPDAENAAQVTLNDQTELEI